MAPQPAVAASGNLIWVLFGPLTAVTRWPHVGQQAEWQIGLGIVYLPATW